MDVGERGGGVLGDPDERRQPLAHGKGGDRLVGRRALDEVGGEEERAGGKITDRLRHGLEVVDPDQIRVVEPRQALKLAGQAVPGLVSDAQNLFQRQPAISFLGQVDRPLGAAAHATSHPILLVQQRVRQLVAIQVGRSNANSVYTTPVPKAKLRKFFPVLGCLARR